MIKKLFKNKFLITLIIIIIILVIIKLSYNSSSQEKISQKNPSSNSSFSLSTPSPNSTPYPTEDEIIDLNRQIPLARLLPYQGKYFKAVRYRKANNIEIIVYDRQKTDLAKKEAQEWLIQNGVDNLDTFTVVY